MALVTNGWRFDNELKKVLSTYVLQGMQRVEIMDYMMRDFSNYKWSLRTLDRRLRHFNIYYTDYGVSISKVTAAVENEMNGPGKLLGYRAMQNKMRQKYDIKVPRDRVYDMMYAIDPERLEARQPGFKRKRAKICFTTKGPNWFLSVDGHDKLMGFQNSTFPLAIYGCMDTASRKMLWLKVWTTNSKPEIIGRWFLEYLYETRMLPSYLRMDRGTETGVMATMQAYLRNNKGNLADPTDSVYYGPSTSNQIERWWKELHERLEKYFKEGLNWLITENHYDSNNSCDRQIF